jgi:molecular chaperone HscA
MLKSAWSSMPDAGTTELMKGTDGYAIEQQTKRLSQVTDAFAARRLDSTVKAALAGRNLNEIEE